MDSFLGGVGRGIVFRLRTALSRARLLARPPRNCVVGDLKQPSGCRPIVIVSVTVVGCPVCVAVPNGDEVTARQPRIAFELEGEVASAFEVP